jgi:hypothetical protein
MTALQRSAKYDKKEKFGVAEQHQCGRISPDSFRR